MDDTETGKERCKTMKKDDHENKYSNCVNVMGLQIKTLSKEERLYLKQRKVDMFPRNSGH